MRARKKNRIKLIIILVLIVVVVAGVFLTRNTKLVLTTGFKKNEVFKIGETSCVLPEVMVYMTNTANQYTKVFGEGVWDRVSEKGELEENIKSTVLARLSRIKTMNLLAKEYGLVLSEKEKEAAKSAATNYYASLTQVEIDSMGVTEDILDKMYKEYALAKKLYDYIIQDVAPEVSDDDARTITIERILLKKTRTDDSGKEVELTLDEKIRVYNTAIDIATRIREGEDFNVLSSEYNEAEISVLSFGRGEMEKAFEDAAYNLGTGEVSGVVETKEGYQIIKCISPNNQGETEVNKEAILEKKKEQAFNEIYEEFVATLKVSINHKLWEEVKRIDDSQVVTSSFWETFNLYYF